MCLVVVNIEQIVALTDPLVPFLLAPRVGSMSKVTGLYHQQLTMQQARNCLSELLILIAGNDDPTPESSMELQ